MTTQGGDHRLPGTGYSLLGTTGFAGIGVVTERTNVLVLKTSEAQASEGSNPSPSATGWFGEIRETTRKSRSDTPFKRVSGSRSALDD